TIAMGRVRSAVLGSAIVTPGVPTDTGMANLPRPVRLRFSYVHSEHYLSCRLYIVGSQRMDALCCGATSVGRRGDPDMGETSPAHTGVMNSLRRVIAASAHELNQPLNAIQLLADNALDELNDFGTGDRDSEVLSLPQ